MLASQFSFEFHKSHEFFFRQYFQEYFFQCAVSFGSVIVVDIAQGLIDMFAQCLRIYLIIGGYVPFMCKEPFVGKPYHGKFWYTDVELLAGFLDRLVHVFHAEVFAYET